MTASDKKADSGPPMHRFIIGDESVLSERDRAGVDNAVSRTENRSLMRVSSRMC